MTIGRVLMVMLAAAMLAVGEARAQQTLTAQDRADIQDLTVRYAKALGSCAAADYAALFAPETGYFASSIRGEVAGRDCLIALVQSERHCIGSTPAGAASSRPAPMVAIESTARGVTGRADLGAAGHYDDEYVKTPQGWRFKSRTVITGQEKAANLTVQDVVAIRRLAGTDLGAVRRCVRSRARRGEAFPGVRGCAWSLA